MRKPAASLGIKSVDARDMNLLAPNAKDSLYDKNDAGLQYEVKGGVGNKNNLGAENTRT